MRAKHTFLGIGELGNYGHRHPPCLLTPGGEINSSGRSRPGAVLRLPVRSPDPASLILFSGHLHPASTGHPGRKAWTRRMLYPLGRDEQAGNGAFKDAGIASCGNWCALRFCIMLQFRNYLFVCFALLLLKIFPQETLPACATALASIPKNKFNKFIWSFCALTANTFYLLPIS